MTKKRDERERKGDKKQIGRGEKIERGRREIERVH